MAPFLATLLASLAAPFIGAGITKLGQKAGSPILGGTESGAQQLPRFDEQQMQALHQILGSSLGDLSNGNFDFSPIAQQYQQDFSQNVIPSIAERFSSMGAQGSSGFANALGQAGAGLNTNLAALGSQYNLGRQQNLLQRLAIGLTPTFENVYKPRQAGIGEGIGSALGSSLPTLAALQYLKQ